MKAHLLTRTRIISKSLVFVFSICFSNLAISQITRTALAKYISPNTVSQSLFFSYDDIMYGYHRLGFGLQLSPTENPAAVFHIKDFVSIDRPVFKIDGKNGNESVIGSVQFLASNGASINYGIKQSGDATFSNYFQSPTGICTSPNSVYSLSIGGKARIITGLTLGDNFQMDFPFVKFVGALDFIQIGLEKGLEETTIMSLNNTMAEVFGKLKTVSFQMTSNAGLGKILASDQAGNGIWANASLFNDMDWIEPGGDEKEKGKSDVLYSNPKYSYIGVGTENPMDRFQVNNGFTKFVIGAGSTGLNSSTSYLGFNAGRKNNEWVLETDHAHNGGNVITADIFGNLRFICVKSQDPALGNQTFTDAQMLDNTKMFISKTGKVGIGTSNPGADLEVLTRGEGSVRAYAFGNYSSTLWAENFQNGFGLSVDSNGIGHILENFYNPKAIVSFFHGKVGIGEVSLPTYTSAHKLFVEGGITTEEVIVKLKNDWSDYVFNKDYRLRSIQELEDYINKNNHLPEIPDAEEVKKNGVDLGQMNALLLKKVEELTLYVIELKKEIQELQVNK